MKSTVRKYVTGALYSVASGAAQALVAAYTLSSSIHLNLAGFKSMGAVAGVGALGGFFLFLKRSPLCQCQANQKQS